MRGGASHPLRNKTVFKKTSTNLNNDLHNELEKDKVVNEVSAESNTQLLEHQSSLGQSQVNLEVVKINQLRYINNSINENENILENSSPM